jgi:hypothetical protein
MLFKALFTAGSTMIAGAFLAAGMALALPASAAPGARQIATPGPIPSPATPQTSANGLCTGTFAGPVSNISLQRSRTGSLTWSFKLTKIAIGKLGPVVEVTLPTAKVNGKAINPPYSPHTKVSTYNFHGSLWKYQIIGQQGTHELATGDEIFLYWLILGSTGEDAYRYIRCTVGKPGS